MVTGGTYGYAFHLPEFVLPTKDVRGGGMQDDFLARKEGQPQVETVVGLRLIVHQSRQSGIMIRPSAAETLRQPDNRTEAGKGIFQHHGRIMPGGILWNRQLRIILILPLGEVVSIRKPIFQIPHQRTVIVEQVNTFAIPILILDLKF